jgi:hypothetical protein
MRWKDSAMSHPEFFGNVSRIEKMPKPEASPNLEQTRFPELGDTRPKGD